MSQREIDLRKLMWLHHVVNLPHNDPVLKVYNGQKTFSCEPNWYNEVSELLVEHKIECSEHDIRNMSKYSWKSIVKRAVHETSLLD